MSLSSRFALSLVCLAPAMASLALEPRPEQARQFQTVTGEVATSPRDPTAELPLGETPGADNSFGLQQVLKKQERLRPFRLFGDVSGFATNNVALTNRNRVSDAFLVANFGLEYRRALLPSLTWDATIRGAIFRYNQVSALNFIGLNAGTGLSYHAENLWNVDFFARYDFTDLINDRNGDQFFTNHALTVGAQKIVPLSRAHYVYAGATAQFGIADPSSEQRFEYAGFAGYHLQATRHLETDLSYRYAFYDYQERSREDHNHTFTVSARYSIQEWVSIYATAMFGVNRSSVDLFNYDVGNIGGGLGVVVNF